jgi:hypothetical protein
MELIEIIRKRLSYLNDQLNIYTRQGELDVIKHLQKEIEDAEKEIQELL